MQRANMAMAKLAEQSPGFALLDTDFCDKDAHLCSIPIQLALKNATMVAQRKGEDFSKRYFSLTTLLIHWSQ
jgi:hypothetical protein